MKLRKPILAGVGAVAAAALLAATALPASAVDDNETVTFTLSGGDLLLAVESGDTLAAASSQIDAQVISGTTGAVTVTDARGGELGWVTSAGSSAFTGAGLSASTAVLYSSTGRSESGTNTIAFGVEDQSIMSTTDPIGLVPVATATGVSGYNTASWTPSLKVSMPAGALTGNYSAVVYTSLL